MVRTRVLLVLFVTVLLVAGATSSSGWAVSDHTVSIRGAFDVPDRQIETKYGTQTLSEVTKAEVDGSLTVDADGPDAVYRVRLANADEQVVGSQGTTQGGAKSFDFDLAGLDPGLYVVALTNDSDRVYDVEPFVIRGYAVDLSVPSEGKSGTGLPTTVEIESLTTVPEPNHVEVVVGNDSVASVVTATKTGDGTYEASVPTARLAPGSYTAYAAVRGAQTASGEREVYGLSDGRDVSLSASDGSETPSAAPDGSGAPGGGGSTTTAPPTRTISHTTTAAPRTTQSSTSTDTPSSSPQPGPADATTTGTAQDGVDATETSGTHSPASAESTAGTAEPSTVRTTTETRVPQFSALGYLLFGLLALAFVVALRRRD